MDDMTATLVAAIGKCIHDRDLDQVPGLVKMLAIYDPETAQSVLDLIALGADLSAKHAGGTR